MPPAPAQPPSMARSADSFAAWPIPAPEARAWPVSSTSLRLHQRQMFLPRRIHCRRGRRSVHHYPPGKKPLCPPRLSRTCRRQERPRYSPPPASCAIPPGSNTQLTQHHAAQRRIRLGIRRTRQLAAATVHVRSPSRAASCDAAGGSRAIFNRHRGAEDQEKLHSVLCGCSRRVSCVFIGGETSLQSDPAMLHPAANEPKSRCAVRPQSNTHRSPLEEQYLPPPVDEAPAPQLFWSTPRRLRPQEPPLLPKAGFHAAKTPIRQPRSPRRFHYLPHPLLAPRRAADALSPRRPPRQLRPCHAKTPPPGEGTRPYRPCQSQAPLAHPRRRLHRSQRPRRRLRRLWGWGRPSPTCSTRQNQRRQPRHWRPFQPHLHLAGTLGLDP